MKPSHIVLMLCIAAIWGFSFVATRVALEVFTPIQMAFARSVLTLILLLPWWQPFESISWRLTLAALTIGTFSFYLLYRAVSITESLTTVAIATQLLPAISAVVALLLYRERVSPRKWTGILIATAGALYLASAADSSLSTAALGLTVLGVLCYSAGSVIIGKSEAVSVWRMLAWISALSLPPLGLMAAASGPLYPEPGVFQAQHWLAIMFVVMFSGLAGQAVLLKLYRIHPVADVAPWLLFIPLFAGLSSILVFDETISLGLFIGGAIVVFGVWVQQSSNR